MELAETTVEVTDAAGEGVEVVDDEDLEALFEGGLTVREFSARAAAGVAGAKDEEGEEEDEGGPANPGHRLVQKSPPTREPLTIK